MSHATKVFTVALLAALASAVAPVVEAQPPIRIGATLSQTGPYATPGQNVLRGYQLCVKHLNDKGGVLGRKLELVLHDDRGDLATAVRLYKNLITQDKVDLVLGPYASPITDAVADVTEKHKMPMVAPVAAATSIYRKGRKFIFSVLSPAGIQLEGFLDLAAKKGLKTVALIYIAALPDAAVESAPVSRARRVFAVALLAALAWAVAPVAEAQPPIRIGASPAQTGAFSALAISATIWGVLMAEIILGIGNSHSPMLQGGCDALEGRQRADV